MVRLQGKVCEGGAECTALGAGGGSYLWPTDKILAPSVDTDSWF